MKENEQQMLLSSSRSANILGRSLILTLHNSRMCMALTFPIKWSPNLTDKWAFGWFMEKYVNDRQIILAQNNCMIIMETQTYNHFKIYKFHVIHVLLNCFIYKQMARVYWATNFQITFHFSDFCILVCYTFIQRNRIFKTFIYVRL